MSFEKALLDAASRRGIPLTPEHAEAMEVHRRLLARWNPAAKLTSLTRDDEILERHFLESLEGMRWLPVPGDGPGRLLDIGSGGGFPALPLLIVRADLTGVLLEPAARKRAFLKEVVRETGLADRVAVRPERVDRAADLDRHAPFEVLTVRAVAGLEDLLDGIGRGLPSGGRALLFPGRELAGRLREALPPGLVVAGHPPLHGRATAGLLVLERR